MNVQFNEEQFKNLQVFLGRVDLKGSEVQAFNDVVSALSRATQPVVVPEVLEE